MRRILVSAISEMLRASPALLFSLLSGCGLFYNDCAVNPCARPLIIKNESNQNITSCRSQNSFTCREVASGSSLEIGEFHAVLPDRTWYPDPKRPWLVICNRPVRVDELSLPGRPVTPQLVNNGDAVVTVDQEVTRRLCGG